MAVYKQAAVPGPSLDQVCVSRLWYQGVTQAGCAPSVLSSLISFGSSASTWTASLYRAAAMLPSPSRHICLMPASPCLRPLLPCITITQRQRNVLAAGQAGRLRVARTSAGHNVKSAHGAWMPHKACTMWTCLTGADPEGPWGLSRCCPSGCVPLQTCMTADCRLLQDCEICQSTAQGLYSSIPVK